MSQDKYQRNTQYESFESAIEAVKDARQYQMLKWPNTSLENAGGRPFEEWALLLHHYLNKLDAVYAETPGNITTVVGDACTIEEVPNAEGRARVKKYMAIIANLAIWGVQAAMDGCGKND
jgi:hypothetical protein